MTLGNFAGFLQASYDANALFIVGLCWRRRLVVDLQFDRRRPTGWANRRIEDDKKNRTEQKKRRRT